MANKNVVIPESGGATQKKTPTYTFSARPTTTQTTTPTFTFSASPLNKTTGTTTATSGTKASTGKPYSRPTTYDTSTPSSGGSSYISETTAPASTPEMTDEEKAAKEAEELESRTFGIPTNRSVERPDYTYTDVPMPARGEQQSWQGLDMYGALLALQDQYNRNMAGMRPKTEAEIQQQAGADYASYYDQLRRAAANQYALQDLAYLQQRQGIQNSYDKNREASARNYAQNYSQADRQLLSRGMQRSSYGAQTLANIARQGAEAQQAIWDQQIQSEGNIDALRQQLLANYANTQQGYDAGQASDVLSRIWGLRDTEYDRQVNRANTLNQLSTQLYSYLNGINEVGREQYNTEANLRENQHQFDTNVAESRQGVLDTRVNNQMANDLNWAQLQEQMYQYANSANLDEAKLRAAYPNFGGYSRRDDGRWVMDKAAGITGIDPSQIVVQGGGGPSAKDIATMMNQSNNKTSQGTTAATGSAGTNYTGNPNYNNMTTVLNGGTGGTSGTGGNTQTSFTFTKHETPSQNQPVYLRKYDAAATSA